MKMNGKCARAVAAILGTHSALGAYAAAADQSGATASDAATGGIAEVVVTAQRRTENAQDVPITMQVFSADSLQQLNVSNFDGLIKYLPNVSAPSAGPGQAQIFMRGLSVSSQGTQSGGSINSFPNVAIYLDDQSGQLPGRNLDVYAADMERIEVLEGPQGTLFGAGAQAGAIRYITNKPKLGATEASVSAGYGTTSGGDHNTDLVAMLNLPVLADKLALRGVIYNDKRGGYIDNVRSTFTRKPTDLGIHYANYPDGCGSGGPDCQVPPSAVAINNDALAGKGINPVTYQGVRVSALWAINDDWNALLTQSYQDMDADGVFYQMPRSSDGEDLPKQSVTLFTPSHNKDKFRNTAWTLNGRLGALHAVYTGSYLKRNVDQVQDYTNYARGVYADYYQCHGADPGNALSATCFSPAATWDETERNIHQSHELRFSTPDDWRFRGIIGAFWEKLQIQDQLNWNYKSLPACTESLTVGCLTPVGPALGSSVNNPDPIRGDNVAFFNDVQRGYKQTAFFTSLDFDLIPKVLTITAGTRHYKFDNSERGAVTGSFGCYQAGVAPCLASATSIDAENLHTTFSGFKSRANLTWHFMPNALLYYTWSQGFRPGAFNRSSGCYIPGESGIPLYCSPLPYTSDDLTNNELGWKTEFLDHHLQWNGAVYQENWKNVQVQFFDPGVLGNVGFNTNGPDYRVRGVETSFIAVLTEGLTAQGAASWNSSEQTNSPFLVANNPQLLNDPVGAGEFGQPILSVQNPYGEIGSPSANSPPLQFNFRMRYEWSRNSYNAFAQAGVTHTAHSYTQSSNSPALSAGSNVSTTLIRFENPPLTQYDASFGVAKDAWSVEAYAQNLTNVVKSTFTSTTQFVPAEAITRPRVLGVRIGVKF